ncbi:hypothetical protein CTI12_AA411920 [Artemisia annua]|uniref:Uncharacterized protein n=1 Tax=Artemisia annua TaxID=35608 RepID=A0A2U1M739_ARTAN|nr:hypothetical protein CTI12_AA411920 [Artemisia annua]
MKNLSENETPYEAKIACGLVLYNAYKLAFCSLVDMKSKVVDDHITSRSTRSKKASIVEETDIEKNQFVKRHKRNEIEGGPSKNKTRKDKYVGTKNTSNKSKGSRSSPRPLYDSLRFLSNSQKNTLVDMGFGFLFGMNIHYMPSTLSRYIVENFNQSSMCIKLRNDSIEITPKLVKEVLGIPLGGQGLVKISNHELKARWKAQFNKHITTKRVAEMIKKTDEAGIMFKMNFLVVFTMLCVHLKKMLIYLHCTKCDEYKQSRRVVGFNSLEKGCFDESRTVRVGPVGSWELDDSCNFCRTSGCSLVDMKSKVVDDHITSRSTRSTKASIVEETDIEKNQFVKRHKHNEIEGGPSKNKTRKDKYVGTKNTSNKSKGSRSSPRPLYDSLRFLSNSQKNTLVDMGFGFLIGMNIHYMPSTLSRYIVENFNQSSIPAITSWTSDLMKDREGFEIDNGGFGNLELLPIDEEFFKEQSSQKDLIYLHCTKCDELNVMRSRPAITSWTSDLMKDREGFEIDNGGFGNLELLPIDEEFFKEQSSQKDLQFVKDKIEANLFILSDEKNKLQKFITGSILLFPDNIKLKELKGMFDDLFCQKKVDDPKCSRDLIVIGTTAADANREDQGIAADFHDMFADVDDPTVKKTNHDDQGVEETHSFLYKLVEQNVDGVEFSNPGDNDVGDCSNAKDIDRPRVENKYDVSDKEEGKMYDVEKQNDEELEAVNTQRKRRGQPKKLGRHGRPKKRNENDKNEAVEIPKHVEGTAGDADFGDEETVADKDEGKKDDVDKLVEAVNENDQNEDVEAMEIVDYIKMPGWPKKRGRDNEIEDVDSLKRKCTGQPTAIVAQTASANRSQISSAAQASPTAQALQTAQPSQAIVAQASPTAQASQIPQRSQAAILHASPIRMTKNTAKRRG